MVRPVRYGWAPAVPARGPARAAPPRRRPARARQPPRRRARSARRRTTACHKSWQTPPDPARRVAACPTGVGAVPVSHPGGTVRGMAAPEVERIDPDPLLSERDTPAAWVDG